MKMRMKVEKKNEPGNDKTRFGLKERKCIEQVSSYIYIGWCFILFMDEHSKIQWEQFECAPV